MNEHLQDLRVGGRPKRKWEIELEEKDKEIERLNKENEELQERIDKAIEYIENNVLIYIDEDSLESITDKEENELIKILRDDKE